MLRAIIVAFFIVVVCFAFVVLQFMPRHGSRAGTASTGPAPLLETREDGSVYAVSLEMTQLERRLLDDEERSRKLQQELAATRKQRDDLEARIDELQDQIETLRRQVNQRPTAPPRPVLPANIPPAAQPNPTGTGTGGPPSTPGTGATSPG